MPQDLSIVSIDPVDEKPLSIVSTEAITPGKRPKQSQTFFEKHQGLSRATDVALGTAQKYAVDPLNKMAARGGEIGAKALGKVGEEYLQQLGVDTKTDVSNLRPPVAAARTMVEGVAHDTGQLAGSFIADPRNWPLLATGAASPALKAAIAGGFTAMQTSNAIDDIRKGNYQSAAINAGFALLGLAGIPETIKSAFLDKIKAELPSERAPEKAASTTAPPPPEAKPAAKAPAAEPSEAKTATPPEGTGLAGVGKGMGKAITSNLYAMLFKKLQAGDMTEAGAPSRVLQTAKPAFDRGEIKSPEELRDFIQNWKPPTQQITSVEPIEKPTIPGPTYKWDVESEKAVETTPIRQELLDRLVEDARGLKKIGAAIPVKELKLTSAEQQHLVERGLTFTVNRMDEPHVAYSQRQRAIDIREKVTGARPPESTGESQPLPGIAGKESILREPQGDHPVVYKVVEASTLKTSHDPFNFAPNPEYPEGVQERQYHTDKNAQAETARHAAEGKWDLFVSQTPTGTDGPPQVTPDGVVLGGNGRSMAIKRAYRGYGAPGYKDYLAEHAQDFGIDPEQVKGMKEPALIREFKESVGTPEEQRRLGRALNKPFTKQAAEFQEAVSAGKNFSPESVNSIAVRLEGLGEEGSIRQVMAADPAMFRSILLNDGVIQSSDLPRYFTKEGALTDTGKIFVENALLGRVIPDSGLLESMPSSVRLKIERSLAGLVELGRREDQWNILSQMQDGIREILQANGEKLPLDAYFGERQQGDLLGSEAAARQVDPKVKALAYTLDGSARKATQAFKRFAAEARLDSPSAPSIFKPDFEETFQQVFQPVTTLHFMGFDPISMKEALADTLQGTKDLWYKYLHPTFLTVSDFGRALGKFSGALNRSDLELMRLTQKIKRAVPKPIRREAITNWIQAGGDDQVLMDRMKATTDPKLRAGYEQALSLTQAEKATAQEIRDHLDMRLQQGIQAGLLESGIENYINQVWKGKRGAPKQMKRLATSIQIGKLAPNPSLIRERIFSSYFDGEQAGYIPKNKDVGFLIASYDQAFNKALASRAFIRSLMGGVEPGTALIPGQPNQPVPGGRASDMRPLVAVAGSGKHIQPSDVAGGERFLIKPNYKPEEFGDYTFIDHPALRKWKWVQEDAEGNPIYLQGDVYVHPEIAEHLQKMLSASKVRQNVVGRTVLGAGREFKSTLLSLSGFHQVQEGLHAVFHGVNPFNPAEIDLDHPIQGGLVDHGLVVADYNAQQQYTEGSGASGLINRLPGIGPYLQQYSEYLFQNYIPRLKMAMAQEALGRNRERYSGRLNEDQLMELTANQANAAFGELNYKMLGRSATAQDWMRLGLLAPDFLEARGRFVGQALSPYGREQLVALALRGAAGMYVGARALNKLLDDDYHWDKPFSVVIKGREYQLRSVPGDIEHLIRDPRSFVWYRLNPMVTRTVMEAATGRDFAGFKRNMEDQVKDFFRAAEPIPMKALGDAHNLKMWESLAQSVGVQEKKSYSRAEEHAMQLRRDSVPLGETTPLQRERNEVKSKLTDQFREDDPNYKVDAAKALREGKITALDKRDIEKKGKDRLISDVNMMKIEDSLTVYSEASDDEKKRLRMIIKKKYGSEQKHRTPAQREQIKAQMQDLGLLPTSPGVSTTPEIE